MFRVGAVTADFADIDGWIDIIDHIWVGFVLIAVAAVPSILSAKNNRGIKRIQDQVVNGHTASNLRDDLDKVMKTLSETSSKVDSISHGLTGMREELIQEETRRRTAISEMREDFDRRFSDLVHRFSK